MFYTDRLWDTTLKFLSPGPRNDVTDHLGVPNQSTAQNHSNRALKYPHLLIESVSFCNKVIGIQVRVEFPFIGGHESFTQLANVELSDS